MSSDASTKTVTIQGELSRSCKYGENPWQQPAALYSTGTDDLLGLNCFELMAGTDPSHNNLCDADRILQTMTHVAAGYDVNYQAVPSIVLGAKHGNCCVGATSGLHPERTEEIVVQRTLEGDSEALFGGLVMLNFPVDQSIAEGLLTYKAKSRRVLDGVIAPDFTEQAIAMLRRKGDKCRFLANPALAQLGKGSLDQAQRFRYVRGGLLVQPNYTFVLDLASPSLVKHGTVGEAMERDMVLAWAVGSTSTSNATTLVLGDTLVGNGVGQQDRVGAAKVSLMRAEDAGSVTRDAVAYSDGYIPFTDALDVLIHGGKIGAILATSGSVRDKEIQEFCALRRVPLYQLPNSEARGFYGH